MITKDVPVMPIKGRAPHNFSKRIPKFNQGNPEIIQDLTHSRRKKTLGKVIHLNFESLKK